ncbi:MAG TPA: hypothetical protein PLP80_15230 [Niabella sp.]|nr:hypothetical protein [Niabella sp.]
METKLDNTTKPQHDAKLPVIGCALIDLEFTGLDNSIIDDNEVIQVKILNINNKKSIIKSFNSKKELSAYTQLEHRTVRYKDCPLFSLDELMVMLAHIDLSIDSDFWGFGVEQDMKMLAKYGWNISIQDIRAHFQRTEFAYRMATEGSGLEPTYLIVTGEYPPKASHADFSEMILIEKLFEKMKEYDADTYMSVVSFGHCSGMLISDYVQEYRRQSDGYRYNNSDAFASALNAAIEELEYVEYVEDDFDDEDW